MALGTEAGAVNSIKDYIGPCREKAQSIVKNQKDAHSREYKAWAYLDEVMKAFPPTDDVEAGLWELFSRARRERY